MNRSDSDSSLATVRAFLAIPLGQDLLDEMQKVQEALRQSLPPDYVRWVRPDQRHLTLRFFGNLPTEDLPNVEAAMKQASTGISEFQLRAEGVGFFPNSRVPRIVWVGIMGEMDHLKRLHRMIQQHTGHWGEPPETREFQPHLTLGRIKLPNAKSAEALGQRAEEWAGKRLAEWRVDRVELMRSMLGPQGSTYSLLATARLERSTV